MTQHNVLLPATGAIGRELMSDGAMGIMGILVGLGIGFWLLAFVSPAPHCLGNDLCLTRPYYYGAWLIAMLITGAGLITYMQSKKGMTLLL